MKNFIPNIKSISVIIMAAILLVSVSCVEYMQDLNRDQKLITDELLRHDANEGGVSLPGMQLGIMDVLTTWRIEMQQNLNADNYGGYMSLPAPFFDNRNNGTYAMVDSWNNQIWLVPSEKVLDQWVMMKKKGFDESYPDLYALSIIFKTFAGHRLADIFGPIPYSKYGESSDVRFDSVEEAYDVFFAELKDAVAVLREAEQENPDADKVRYAKFDKSRYGGDYDTWIKVANTLRLRLAIRISKVDPERARQEAESALAEGGVLTAADVSFEMSTGTIHPLETITSAWQETRINAMVETLLGGYNDPRLPVYAVPASDPDLNGQIKGVRSGAIFGAQPYLGFSQVNFFGNPYVKVMDVAESFFLRAEGALRGWNMGGTAKDFYEEGIRVSFNANGVGGVDEYLNNSTGTQLPYVDPYNPANNIAPTTDITVKWEENDTFERKLERIITQKWIAMYPDGQEAWSEFRRTGYPKLYPVAVNYSEFTGGEYIKRITYPTSITNSSQASVEEAIGLYLNGEDNIFTPLWWDVD
ncbi:Susd and RagB outer membrane lipoprotein [Cyclobacterium lianum]|uniref:Susd and RagB outer membrane lipoprotein n=2 Tax=Cyclobacterium lianum TaxID=388280 RepID=A0A1M7PYX1_9BACT|nr:Susd and RagB outer membrane lipoprotein [Cyclobacterium lianum]